MYSRPKATIGPAVIVLGVSIALGIVAGWLAGLLVFVALVLAFVGMSLLVSESAWLGWTVLVLGLAVMALATWTTGMEGRWWWLAPWLLIGLFSFGAGAAARPGNRGLSDTLLTIGVLTTIFAVLGPLVVYGGLAGVRENGIGWTSGGNLSLAPLSDFFTTVFTSFWGYVSLLLVFLIGVAWGGNKGGVVALVLLPIVVLVTGWIDPNAATTLSDWLAAGPIEQLARILRGSDADWGTAGWGVLIVGAAVALVCVPTLRRMVRANGLLALATDLQRQGREEEPSAFVARNMDAWPYVSSLFVFFGVYGMAPIMMWLALRRVADGGTLPFPPIGMPDLAAPQWRPVWDASYFLVALALAILALALGRAYRHYGAETKVPIIGNPVWQATVPFIAALFVPGGVMLLGAAAALVTLIELPAAAAGIKDDFERLARVPRPSGPAPGPEPMGPDMSNLLWLSGSMSGPKSDEESGTEPQPGPEPEPGPEPGPEPEPVSVMPSADVPSRPQPGGVLTLAETGSVLVDVIVAGTANDIELVTLGQDGSLVRWQKGVAAARSTLPVVRPLGLATAAAGRVFVVEGEGRIVDVSLSAHGHETVHSCATGAIACFAGHPHGNHVAFAQEGEEGIQVFGAATEKVDILVSDVAVPTSLAFARTGRYLAAGDARGAVVRVDMLKKGIEPLADAGAGGAVARLAGCPKGCWAAMFAGGELVVWDENREPCATGSAGGSATALTVDHDAGLVAVGGADGSVKVLAADLNEVLFDERLHDAKVCRLEFVNGRLVSAGADGRVLLLEI